MSLVDAIKGGLDIIKLNGRDKYINKYIDSVAKSMDIEVGPHTYHEIEKAVNKLINFDINEAFDIINDNVKSISEAVEEPDLYIHLCELSNTDMNKAYNAMNRILKSEEGGGLYLHYSNYKEPIKFMTYSRVNNIESCKIISLTDLSNSMHKIDSKEILKWFSGLSENSITLCEIYILQSVTERTLYKNGTDWLLPEWPIQDLVKAPEILEVVNSKILKTLYMNKDKIKNMLRHKQTVNYIDRVASNSFISNEIRNQMPFKFSEKISHACNHVVYLSSERNKLKANNTEYLGEAEYILALPIAKFSAKTVYEMANKVRNHALINNNLWIALHSLYNKDFENRVKKEIVDREGINCKDYDRMSSYFISNGRLGNELCGFGSDVLKSPFVRGREIKSVADYEVISVLENNKDYFVLVLASVGCKVIAQLWDKDTFIKYTKLGCVIGLGYNNQSMDNTTDSTNFRNSTAYDLIDVLKLGKPVNSMSDEALYVFGTMQRDNWLNTTCNESINIITRAGVNKVQTALKDACKDSTDTLDMVNEIIKHIEELDKGLIAEIKSMRQ